MKRHLHLRILCLLAVAAACTPLKAVDPGLALTRINFTIQNDTAVNLGYTITINAQLTNTDTAVFSGQLDFGLRNSTQILTQAGIFKKPPYSNNTIILNPGETVPAIFSVKIDDQYFAPGPDVVVVWPISTKPVTDSILIELNIASPTAIYNEPEVKFDYFVYSDKIVLHNLPAHIMVKQVRIYNLFGQLVDGAAPGFANEIPIGNIPKGIYFCEMLMADRSRKVIKFLK
ncbi:MAG: T9SS type A sorting domain-containing protein [Chitinophagales bacterium]|nr:T9SS type A sorting domain-containing protein [Chitinophagales bacterium]